MIRLTFVALVGAAIFAASPAMAAGHEHELLRYQ
jgi:hypothetical protein